MDVGLDADQEQLRDSARSMLAVECPTSVVRDCYRDTSRWRGIWKTLVEVGWTDVGHGDDDRGDVLDLVVLMEQAGFAVLPAPLLGTVGLAGGALRAVDGPSLSIGDEIAAGAVAAFVGDPLALRPTDSRLRFAAGRVAGTVDQVRDAERAEVFVALADSVEGVTLVGFRRGAGVVVRPSTSIDPSQPVGTVEVDLTPEFAVPTPVERLLAVPLVAAAAELVGVADRALTMSVDYAKTREQFGQPIGAFQAVKHRLADCYVALERARSLTYLAAARCSTDRVVDARTWRAALLAKAAAGEAAATATRAAVAVHGAIAQTWEHDAHLLLRRAWQSSALLGDGPALYAAAARSYVEAARS